MTFRISIRAICNFLIIYCFYLIGISPLAAEQCVEKYDKSSLPYPSRQTICPNGGSFIDFFTGVKYPCEEGHVDHVIPTKFMYTKGLCGDYLKAFSKDRDNLRMVHSSTNLEKSDKNPIQYALLHSDDAEIRTTNLVRTLEGKGYPVSTDSLTKEAYSNQKEDLRLQYRQKIRAKKALKDVRLIRRNIKLRMSKRLLRSLTRNTALTVGETSAGAVVPGASKVVAVLAVGALALEIRDTCENLKDLDELDTTESPEGLDKTAEKVCGLELEDIMSILGVDLKLRKCIQARENTNEVNPPACEEFKIEEINYDTIFDETVQKRKAPSYD